MLDDDIQYLGSRIKLRDPPRYMQRTVSGAALHIEKSDGNEAYVLTFNRDKSSTVHVGRRPGNENESRPLDQENGRAMFRCAVVSRRHARIVFTDSGNVCASASVSPQQQLANSGQVFLIDLDSHHGTHIRKPGETSSRMLEPEIPTPLSDGDIITFGKTVGRNEEMVRPIVARVQLLHSGPSTSAIKPLVVPESSPNRSGRYGLHSPSSSSSDEAYNGQSDAYSDIEEIPPPVSITPRAGPQTDSESKSESFHLGRAFEVFKRLLPPTSAPPEPAAHDQREQSPRLEEQSPIHSESSSSSVPPPSNLPSLWTFPDDRASPFPLLPRYPSISSVDLPNEFYDLPPINPANIINDGELSRSESPMDLASPSPPPPEQEPLIIGAWANFSSPSSSESESIATPPDNEVPVVNNDAAETPAATTAAVQHEDNHEAESTAVVNEATPLPPSLATATDKGKQREQIPTVDSSSFITRLEYEQLKAKYSNLQNEIDILQAQRRKYKTKFNANVHTVTDKFHELEDKMNDMAAQCTLFMDQIEDVTSGDVPDIQARIDDLVDEDDAHRRDIDDLMKRAAICEERDDETDDFSMLERERLQEEKERAQKYLDTLKVLIDDMKALRAVTEQEMEAELANLRQLRESIMHEQNDPSTPTKRKRTLDDEGDHYSDTIDNTTTHAHDEEFHDAPMHSSDEDGTMQPQCSIGFHISHDQPSPRKRARRIASVAAQTATAVTMGAVAAWVALAFS
ncbi:hypothetical protein D9756_011111 [Leucocoprinus leucothites]|uniref:FHA domain-containing protein n=1 Tax=Leucocoprinus leucothites TaxID=201217 RepID=A0A8H5CVJ7_9AGAR|nr:hypothetical protein D9756_011111 [Leucoagaricus leucothites]